MRDNVTSCLARIFMVHSDSKEISAEAVVDAILGQLPLKVDFAENNITWAAVVKLVNMAGSHAKLVEPRLPRVLTLFGEALSLAELNNTPARTLIVRTCRSLMSTPPAAITTADKLQAIVKGWPEARQTNFQKALAASEPATKK